MASDFTLVDPSGWELDLHSVYSAYMGHFQLHSIAWYDRSWASLFTSFDAFLSFGWPAVIVTDARTGRPHIVTRLTSVGAFVKMVKTRFGEVLPPLNNIVMVQPYETSQRHLRTISDAGTFKKIFSTLPAAALAARRTRVRQGDIGAIRKLWHARESLWLAVSFDLSERTGSINAWGYSVLRAPHLEASGAWPPNPADNYRKGYYVVQEALERRAIQTSPRDFVWAEANVVPKSKLPDIVGAIISSLAGPESESQPNPLIIVTHGEIGALAELKIKLPNNTFIVDVGVLEKNMYTAGMRGNNPSRSNSATLSLTAILRSLDADLSARGAPYGVAGNDALATLLALQMLMGDAPATMPTPARPRFQQTHSTPNFQQILHPGMPAAQIGRHSFIPPVSGGPFRGAALQSGPPSPRRNQPFAQLQPTASVSTSQLNYTGVPHGTNGRSTPSGAAPKPHAATFGRSDARAKELRRASVGATDGIVDAMGQLRT